HFCALMVGPRAVSQYCEAIEASAVVWAAASATPGMPLIDASGWATLINAIVATRFFVIPTNQNEVFLLWALVSVPVLPAIRLLLAEYQFEPEKILAEVPPAIVSPVSRLTAVRAT